MGEVRSAAFLFLYMLLNLPNRSKSMSLFRVHDADDRLRLR